MAALAPISNLAECSEAGLHQAYQREGDQDDGLHEVGILHNESSGPKLSSFQIRAFVSTVRSRDFHKCWPFRHKILEKCLSMGLKPFLPPFEPPLKGCDSLDDELEISSLRLQGGTLQIDEKDVSAKCEKQDCEDADTLNLATSAMKLHDAEPDAGHESGREYIENDANCIPVVTRGRALSGIAKSISLENAQVEPSNDLEVCMGTPQSEVPAVSVGGVAEILEPEKIQGHSSPFTDKPCPQPIVREEEESTFHHSGPFGSEACSSRVSRGASTKKDQHQLKGKYKLMSLECPSTEKQFSNPSASNISTHEKHTGDVSKSLDESLHISDQATALCNEASSLGLASKFDRSSRNGEDYACTGLNFDTLIPQVCPVCLNFTSTSNTALNAHIDHCLESVLPGEKGESKECKSKIKPRKMRSMVDICATAPSRTLEDLELSSKMWALNDNSPKGNIQAAKLDHEASKVKLASSSLKSGVVRRQPRTSLYRGSAWRSKGSIDVEDAPEESGHEAQHQLENGSAFQRKIAVGRPMSELPCEDQQLPQGKVCQTLHMVSSIQSAKVGWSKKKESMVFSNVTLLHDSSSQGLCQSDEERSDDGWSVPISLLGFTVLDTSAEEERRLQQKLTSVPTQEMEVEEEEETGENHATKSGKIYATHQVNVPFLSTNGNFQLKSPSSNEPAKKRKRLGVGGDDVDDNVEMEGIVSQQVQHFERLTKNKRVVPKIKSLLTLVANSCQDESKNGFEDISNQRKPSANGVHNGTGNEDDASIPGIEPSSYKETTCKRKSLGARNDDTHESSCNANKQARVCPPHVHGSPEGFGSDHLAGQAVFYRRTSAVSKRADRTTHKVLHSGSFASCLAEANPQNMIVEEIHRENFQGEGRRTLISTSSNHQAGEEDLSRGIVAKSNTTNVNTSNHTLPVKVSHHGLEHLESSGHGALHYNTSSEASRQLVVSMALEKVSCLEKQEAEKKTTNDTNPAEQVVHGNLSVSPATKVSSQRFTFNVSVRCSTNLKSREDGSKHGPQRPHVSDNVLGMPPRVHNDKSPSRDSQEPVVGFPPLSLESARFSKLSSKDNTVIINRPLLAATDRSDNHGNYDMRSLVEHGIPLASLVVSSESLDKSGVNASQHVPNRHDVSNLDRRISIAVDRLEQPDDPSRSAVQGVNRTVNIDAPHQSQSEYVCSQFLAHDLGPMILSSASAELAHSGRHQYVHEASARDYTPMPSAGRERGPLPSCLLADLTRTMAHTSPRQQDRVSPSSHIVNEQQRTFFHCTDLGRGHASPRQGMTKGSLASNGSAQLHSLQSALHAINGAACANFSATANPVATDMDVPGKTMPPFSTDSSSTRFNGRRQSLYGTELPSVLSNYGTLEYPGDQGVVHIFGSPVFKLMGQNVMVTNKNTSSLGMESTSDQNGRPRYYPPSSIRHVAVLPETLNIFSHNPSQDSSSTARGHGDACISRCGSFVSDNVNVHPSAPSPVKSAYSKLPGCRSTAIQSGNFGEKSHGLSSSGAGTYLNKQDAVSIGSRPPTEVFIVNDRSPGCNPSMSAFLNLGNRMATTSPSGGSLTSNMRLWSRHEPRLAGQQPLAWQSSSSPCLADVHQLDLSGRKSQHGSGTLADIVQSSERTNK